MMLETKFWLDQKETFEKHLLLHLQPKQMLSSSLYDACLYALSGGGKRLRPLLVFSVAYFCGKPFSEVEHFAAALEYIHNYSLIHDDLPCMDDDDIRRGKPTVHRVYGEALALLAGDALLNTAMEIALEDILQFECKEVSRAYAHMFRKAGSAGMIDGQAFELQMDEEKCHQSEMMLKKTAYLFDASLKGAAIRLSLPSKVVDLFAECAEISGYLFQCIDDLKDQDGVYEDASFSMGSVTKANGARLKMVLDALDNYGKTEFLREVLCMAIGNLNDAKA